MNSSQRGSQRVRHDGGSVSFSQSDLNIAVWVCGEMRARVYAGLKGHSGDYLAD